MKKFIVVIFINFIFINLAFSSIFAYSSDPEEFKSLISNVIAEKYFEGEFEKIDFIFPEIGYYNLVTGYLPYIKIVSEKILLDDLLTDFLYLELSNIKLDLDALYNKNKLKPNSEMQARIYVEISEKELNNLLKKKQDKIKVGNPDVKIRKDKIILSGNVRAMFMSSSVESRGRFEIKDKRYVYFKTDYIKVSRIRLPRFMLNNIIKTINPVLDIGEFGFDIEVDNITMYPQKGVISSFDKNKDRKALLNE
ncbi:MAG: hypothetical protein ACQESP_00805 [Candidatus Muiribacteriota bacterium]